MCGPQYDEPASNLASRQLIANRLDNEYDYQVGHREGETREAFRKRQLASRTHSEIDFDNWYAGGSENGKRKASNRRKTRSKNAKR